MKDCRLVLFTLQDTLSLHSHHCPACKSQSQQLQSILYEILSGWSFVIGSFLGWSFVIGGFLQGENSVGGVAGGRCSLLGGGRSLEATNGVLIRSSNFGCCRVSGRSSEARCSEVPLYSERGQTSSKTAEHSLISSERATCTVA